MMKEKFLEIYRQNISRPGADKLLAWLETTDFFEAPASTRFHLSRPGGLVEHRLHDLYVSRDNAQRISHSLSSLTERKRPSLFAPYSTTSARPTSTRWR
mgnify:CR=1 FL=1